MAKLIEFLARNILLIFNGYKLIINGNNFNIILFQKGQRKRLTFIDFKSGEFK